VVTLEENRLFSILDEPERDMVSRLARERELSPGEEIFRQGDAGDGLYVVKQGLVEISGVGDQNARHAFSQVGPGEMFGEMAVLEDKPRSASARALKPTVVYFLERHDMLALVQKSPALALGLLKQISNRLREFDRQYLEEILQTERLAVIGRFARSIVHDLKNPLNIIGITAEMAALENATLAMRKNAQTQIRKQVDRISEMISEILEFTQGGKSTTILTGADYGEFVGTLMEEIRPEAGLRATQVEFVPAPSAGLKVLLDPRRLRRVFFNLVHNSTDAMPRGGHITVRLVPKGNEIVTEIEDNGPGIPNEVLSHLFQAFVTYGKAHGTGLGLSICKRIVEDHKGWIDARNSATGGAVFSFGLPVVK
jgi:signal transduction histidine kinase